METLVESVHPLRLVPITVYVVVAVGVATGLGQLLQLRLAEGVQRYVEAPPMESGTEFPLQIESLEGVAAITGIGNTFTLIESTPVHPPESLAITVYVVVTVGVAVGLTQVVQVNPLEGCQLYVWPPCARREILFPRQTESLGGTIVIVGGTGLPTVTTVVSPHPLLSITMHVYVPAESPVIV
jgi:hypothetical protein